MLANNERLPLRLARKTALVAGIALGVLTTAVVINKGMDRLQPLPVIWACLLSASLIYLGKEPRLVAKHESLQSHLWYRLLCVPFGWVWSVLAGLFAAWLSDQHTRTTPKPNPFERKNKDYDSQMIEFLHGMRGPPDDY